MYKLRQCFRIGSMRPLWKLLLFRMAVRLGRISAKNMDIAPVCTGAQGRVAALPNGQPLVSVIIPCFNYGAYVLEAIDSVLGQSVQDAEIIVVDGGSTDVQTLELLGSIDRPRTRVLFQPVPTLVGANRNLGIAHSHGKYICCLDADDRLKPEYLKKTTALLESGLYDIASAGYEVLGKVEQVLLNMPNPLLEDMVLGNHMLTCAVFSRELFDRTSGFVDTGKGPKHVAEDWRLWIHMAALGARMYNLSEPLLEYRVHTAPSLSTLPGVPPAWAQAKAICAELERAGVLRLG